MYYAMNGMALKLIHITLVVLRSEHKSYALHTYYALHKQIHWWLRETILNFTIDSFPPKLIVMCVLRPAMKCGASIILTPKAVVLSGLAHQGYVLCIVMFFHHVQQIAH